MSHTTVGSIVKRVGKSQADYDKALVEDLEYSAELPEGKKQVPYLFTEADGVYVRDLKKKKHIEVSHAILYEGRDKNGDRVSLRNPNVIMSTQSLDNFWKGVQNITTNQ